MQTYCERCGPGLFDEPINATSNVVFLLAAWAAWRFGVRHRAVTVGLCVLIGMSVAIGVGSALWHTFATPWASFLDVVPIMLFQLSFLWLYGRQIAMLNRTTIVLLLIGYIGAGHWLLTYSEWLNGVLIYGPTFFVSWAVGLHYYLSERRERCILLCSAMVFCLALFCRTIDLVICRQFPIGTHFMWHVLNGLVVYLAMRALIVDRSRSIGKAGGWNS